MEAYKTLIGRQYADRIQLVKRDIEDKTALGGEAAYVPLSEHIIATRRNESVPTWLHPFFHEGNLRRSTRLL